MTRHYDSPPTRLRALRDRLTAAAKREGVSFGRLQQHVGVLVVAQFFSSLTDDQGEPRLLVKGGVSLELRRGIPESRTSKDLDAVIRGSIESAHDRLVEAGLNGWEGFTATFTQPIAFDVPGLGSRAHRFMAKLSYMARPFVSVPIEVSPVEAGNAESYDLVGSEAFALVGLPKACAVPCMTLPWQIAQKVHACTDPVEPPRTNDRAHDLVDLQILEALVSSETLSTTRVACLAVFDARESHSWPPILVAPEHWPAIYDRALEGLDGLGLAPNLSAAVGRVQAFIHRIDQATSDSGQVASDFPVVRGAPGHLTTDGLVAEYRDDSP